MAELTPEKVRELAQEAVRQLGPKATPELVYNVVEEAIGRIRAEESDPHEADSAPRQTPLPEIPKSSGSRIIVTAFGRNHTGILAGMTGVMAENNCDIMDLTQKMLQEFFTMMLLVDISQSSCSYEELKSKIVERGESLDLKVVVQHEELFNAMHRV